MKFSTATIMSRCDTSTACEKIQRELLIVRGQPLPKSRSRFSQFPYSA